VNVFDLRGPEFLFFYAALSAVALGLLAWWASRQHAREHVRSQLPIDDPMLIAFLRGGMPEAIDVAIASLVDRGLLASTGGGILESKSDPSAGSRPMDAALLRVFQTPAKIGRARLEPEVRRICAGYRTELLSRGLVPGGALPAQDVVVVAATLAGLLAIGALKIFVALERGRHNLGFLVMLMALDVMVAIPIVRGLRMRGVRQALDDLRVLFKDLRGRSKTLQPGRATNDLEYLAAVFGAAALPVALFPDRDALFPPHTLRNAAMEGVASRQHGATCATATSCGAFSSGASSCGGGGSCGGGSGCGGGGCGGCGS
jgi:uncharacterized protein (TIGR04222 family)